MRILKYLFFLLLLSLVAFSIFVATQKGEYTVERSQIINSPKATVFNYINDYRNWEDFVSWAKEDPAMKFIYPTKTIGSGASYSWEGKDGTGNMSTVFVKENDSISQKMDYNGDSSAVMWSFKDTVGGTKVTWKTIGKNSFTTKIFTALNGGLDKTIGKMYEKSLANLDRTLDYEINTYTVKVNGLAKKSGTYYLTQTFTSTISNVTKNSRIVFPKIINFCKENNIPLNGKPFAIYHTYDLGKGLTRLSLCVPIKSQILTSSGSDILSGKLEPFDAVKTTLTGDYSHLKESLDKTIKYANTSGIAADPSFSHLESYNISRSDIKNPSKWVTEIYYPTKPKAIPVKSYKPAIIKKVEPIKTPEPVIIKEEEKSEF